MLNRAALILRYKQPAVDWVNKSDLYNSPGLTLASANEDLNVYLIANEDSDDPELLQRWIKLNLDALFIDELSGWYTDESLWPKTRNMKLFNSWFSVECHTVLNDTVGTPLVDDEL